jgi:hypothetical protein
LPVLEALEERRLLAGSLLGGLTHLASSPPALAQTATVQTVPTAGTLINLPAAVQTPGPATSTDLQATAPVTVDSQPGSTGGLLAGVLPVAAAVPEPLAGPAPLPTTSGSTSQTTDNAGTPSLLSVQVSEAATAALQTQADQPGLSVAASVNLGAALPLLPDLGVSVAAAVGTGSTSDSGPGTGTGTTASGGTTLNVGGNSGSTATGGLQLGVDVGSLLDATVGLLLGGTGSPGGDGGGGTWGGGSAGGGSSGTGTSGGAAGTPSTPGDPGTQGQGGQPTHPDSGPGVSNAGGRGKGDSAGGTAQANPQPGPGSVTVDPGPNTMPPPGENGGSSRTTPAELTGGAGQGAVADPGSGSGAPVQRAEGEDPRTEVRTEVMVAESNPQDNAPPQPEAVVNPVAAPLQPQPLQGGANLNPITEALFGTATGSWWLDTGFDGLPGDVASEIAGALLDGPLGSLEAPPDEPVPLSQGEDLVNGLVPFDARTLEAGLRRFLEQLEVSGRQLAQVPSWVWLLAAATLAAGEVMRRRWRRQQTALAAADELRETLRWFPDLGHTEEDA